MNKTKTLKRRTVMAKKKPTALTKSTKKLTSKGPIPKEGKPEFQASFSLTFKIGKDDPKSFTVSMSDITGIIENGFELELPKDKTFPLGSFIEFYQWIGEKFKISLPDLTNIPVVKDFMTGVVTIMIFHLKLPGTVKKDQLCDLAVNIKFQEEISIIGSLALSDVDFGLTYKTVG
jgi:hypothetical protein